MRTGYVQVYTGDGKGKTTAAFGLALRAAGSGCHVYIAQFGKAAEESIHGLLERLSDLITVERFGLPHFIREEPTPGDIAAAGEGLTKATDAMLSGQYDVVVLDEACLALHYNLFQLHELLHTIQRRPPYVEVVLTGRRAPQPLIDAADLVTEMRPVKHYYDKGVKARRGIES